MKIIKKEDEQFNEKFLKNIIGKYIHAPTNEHVVYDPLEKDFINVNAWFAGKIAGYEKLIYAYDYKTDEFFDEMKTIYRILLCDGTAYALSEEKSILEELTEEEFIKMVAEHDSQ